MFSVYRGSPRLGAASPPPLDFVHAPGVQVKDATDPDRTDPQAAVALWRCGPGFLMASQRSNCAMAWLAAARPMLAVTVTSEP